MFTEKEAQDHWCPFVRVGQRPSGATENRPDGSYNCIASGCMAWRWSNASDETKHHMRALRMEPTNKRIGYCGLAGKP